VPKQDSPERATEIAKRTARRIQSHSIARDPDTLPENSFDDDAPPD
jgi:hypothetical protein